MNDRRMWVSVLIVPMALALAATRAGANYVDPSDFDFKSILGPPPAPDSDQQKQEIDLMLKLQDQRSAEDSKRVMAEAKFTPFVFSESLGSWFNPDDLPQTMTFLVKVNKEAGEVCSSAKQVFLRTRPFKTDPRIHPCVESEKSTSYPSSHSTRATTLALVLSAMFPDHKDALMARAKLIGDDRVVAGQHFPSDVAAGRVLAQAIFDKMSKNPEFQSDFEKVKEECLAKEKSASP
jgi:acid phosphatase (class A)